MSFSRCGFSISGCRRHDAVGGAAGAGVLAFEQSFAGDQAGLSLRHGCGGSCRSADAASGASGAPGSQARSRAARLVASADVAAGEYPLYQRGVADAPVFRASC